MARVPGPTPSIALVQHRGSRRTIPAFPTDAQRDRLRRLAEDPDTWVLRQHWDRYLFAGELHTATDPATLSPDHQQAALAWLRQQRHALYRAIEGGRRAPDGWLEGLPLYQHLEELAAAAPPSREEARSRRRAQERALQELR